MIYTEIIKPLLSINQFTVAKLAEEMSKELNKKYTRSSLNGKFARDTLSMKECQAIAKILGYHIAFIKNK
ncbi:MAG TPA: hypothetical protein IAD11_10085 [Candidatus Stercorousia faecigallinarum]|nr:hypothetical protein [Candidatus Stercorousia faecigallinarum]